jgi:hypothetical protein
VTLTICCPACGWTGSKEDPHEILHKVLDEPKLSGKDDLAYQPIRCGACGHEFYPLAIIGGKLTSHFFDENGKRWEGDQKHFWWNPNPANA